MNRTALTLTIGSIILMGVLGPAAIAAAAPVSVPKQGGFATTGVQDFTFASYSGDFYLDRDSAGHSILKTVEAFVATFPAADQNRGMQRAIPTSYQGASTGVEVVSVTDGKGNARAFTTETDDNGFLVVTSRDDNFVHGNQTYVFTYTQRYVTRFFADTNKDEFYWDTNGTGFAQPFGSLSARVHVPAALSAALVPGESCYRGVQESTQKCPITKTAEAGGQVFSVAVEGIGPGANVTVDIPFQPNTFVPRNTSYFASPLSFVQLVALLASFAALVWAIVLRRTRLADAPGRPTIIAEYTPPRGLDVVTAAVIIKKPARAAAAEILDLAIKRKIRLVDAVSPGVFSKSQTFALELVDPAGLQGPAFELAQALFGAELVVGTTYTITGRDATLSSRVRLMIQRATSAATTDGLRKQGTALYARLAVLAAVLALMGTVVSGFGLLGNGLGGGLPFLIFLPAILVLVIVSSLTARKPLTAAGSELRDHLKGLELYIRLAEADRLKMLQSPTGAERTSGAGDDPRQIVKVYEKLLPCATLFNLERQWAAELGKYYAEESPDWYRGTDAFNTSMFVAGIGGLSTAASTSYSESSSSSSSGGSGGGGSSGGGGGGGGGGGV